MGGAAFYESGARPPACALHTTLDVPSQTLSRGGLGGGFLPHGCGVISGSCTELGTICCQPHTAMSHLNNKHVSWALQAYG